MIRTIQAALQIICSLRRIPAEHIKSSRGLGQRLIIVGFPLEKPIGLAHIRQVLIVKDQVSIDQAKFKEVSPAKSPGAKVVELMLKAPAEANALRVAANVERV